MKFVYVIQHYIFCKGEEGILTAGLVTKAAISKGQITKVN
jgi:hypothetical protein